MQFFPPNLNVPINATTKKNAFYPKESKRKGKERKVRKEGKKGKVFFNETL